jgi:MFS family permease
MIRSRLSALVPAGRSERILSAASFLYGIGFGSFAASSVLFFTRSVGLSAGQVGTGTAVAGLVAVVAAVAAGRLADHVGARNLLVVLSVAQAVLFAQYSVVTNVPSFVVVVGASAMADQGARVARNTVIAGMCTGRERVRLKAFLRSVTNVGMALGSLLSAIPLALDTRPAYLAVIFANAVAAAITAVLVTRLPSAPAPAGPGRSGWVALRDRSYMSVAVLSGLLVTSRSLLTIAMPLWVATHTAVPRTVVAALLVGNTILDIVLQVPTSRRADTAESLPPSYRYQPRSCCSPSAWPVSRPPSCARRSPRGR